VKLVYHDIRSSIVARQKQQVKQEKSKKKKGKVQKKFLSSQPTQQVNASFRKETRESVMFCDLVLSFHVLCSHSGILLPKKQKKRRLRHKKSEEGVRRHIK
jgi:hypothetical protein